MIAEEIANSIAWTYLKSPVNPYTQKTNVRKAKKPMTK